MTYDNIWEYPPPPGRGMCVNGILYKSNTQSSNELYIHCNNTPVVCVRTIISKTPTIMPKILTPPLSKHNAGGAPAGAPDSLSCYRACVRAECRRAILAFRLFSYRTTVQCDFMEKIYFQIALVTRIHVNLNPAYKHPFFALRI